MSNPLITWEQLQKSKTIHRSMSNSSHMSECIAFVIGKCPDAKIVEVKEGELWELRNGDQLISNPHNSIYQCWSEAADIIRSNVEAE